MTWLFLIVSLIIFVYISYRRPLYGIAIIIAILPSYLWRLSFFGLPSTFLELMLVSLFIIWLIKDRKYLKVNLSLGRQADNRVPLGLRCLLATWLLASLIALAVNPTVSALGLWRAYFLEPIMFFLVFVYSVDREEDLKIVIKALGLLLGWIFLLAIYQLFTGWNLPVAYDFPNVRRLTVLYSYPNAVALLTAPIAAFFAGLWLNSDKRKANLWYLIIFIIGFSLSLLARSDGAIIALFISLFFWLILARKVRRWGQILSVIALLVIIFVRPVTQYFNSFRQQLFRPELNLTASSIEIRSNQWQETWAMLKDNFIFGAGIDGYQDLFKLYHQAKWVEVYLYPHNIFLNFWTELGLFGLLVFIALAIYIIFILRELFKRKNKFAWSLTLTWLVWFIHGLVDVPYFKNDLSVLFFMFLALSTVLTQCIQRRNKTKDLLI